MREKTKALTHSPQGRRCAVIFECLSCRVSQEHQRTTRPDVRKIRQDGLRVARALGPLWNRLHATPQGSAHASRGPGSLGFIHAYDPAVLHDWLSVHVDLFDVTGVQSEEKVPHCILGCNWC